MSDDTVSEVPGHRPRLLVKAAGRLRPCWTAAGRGRRVKSSRPPRDHASEPAREVGRLTRVPLEGVQPEGSTESATEGDTSEGIPLTSGTEPPIGGPTFVVFLPPIDWSLVSCNPTVRLRGVFRSWNLRCTDK